MFSSRSTIVLLIIGSLLFNMISVETYRTEYDRNKISLHDDVDDYDDISFFDRLREVINEVDGHSSNNYHQFNTRMTGSRRPGLLRLKKSH